MFSNGSLVALATTVNLPQKVLRWKTMVEEECNAQGVSELVPYVLGIIMVESGGDSETTPILCSQVNPKGDLRIQLTIRRNPFTTE